MRLLVLLTTVVAAVAITATPAGAHIIRPGCTSKMAPRAELACARFNRQHALATIGWARDQQRSLTFAAYDAATSLRLAHMIDAHRWLYRAMAARMAEARSRMLLRVPLTGDWLTAVRQVQRVFPESEDWLVSCSRGEGGHGAWTWYAHESVPRYGPDRTPGGWLQYMQGTFWTDYRQAVADARSRGFVVPSASASYTSATGMALAGGWAYSHARPAGKWTGGGC